MRGDRRPCERGANDVHGLHAFLVIGLGGGIGDRRLQHRDCGVRCTGRHHRHEHELQLQSGISQFGCRGQVRQQGRTAAAGDRQRPDLARLDLRQQSTGSEYARLHFTRHQGQHGRCVAAVVDGIDLDPGGVGQHQRPEMAGAAIARSGEGQHLGSALVDQCLHLVHPEGGMYGQDAAGDATEPDGPEVGVIDAAGGVERGCQREWRIQAEQNRITVRRRPCDLGGTDVAGGPGDVLDHDRLLERGGHARGQQPGNDVQWAAGREVHDDLDGAFGEAGRRRRHGCQGCRRRDTGSRKTVCQHSTASMYGAAGCRGIRHGLVSCCREG